MNTNIIQGSPPTVRPGAFRISYRAIALPAILVATLLALALLEPRFLNQLNLLNLSRNISFLTIVGLGQMLVMLLGGLDLSVGVVVAISSVTAASMMNHAVIWWPGNDAFAIAVACLSAMGVAAMIGLLNGLFIVKGRASAFIVTLGMFSVVGGVAYYVTAGIPIYGLPASFTNTLGRGMLFGLPCSVHFALFLVAAILIVQQRTRIGRYLYAVGGNAHAANLSGIPVNRTIISAYVACSFLAGLAGLLITARIGAGQANLGSEYMLHSIAVCVIAGVSLRGGVGRVERVFLSAILLTIFANAMNLVRIDSKLQTIVFGIVLLGAAMMDRSKQSGGGNA